MQSSEIPAIATLIGTALTFLGITHIDTSVISNAVQGVIALVTLFLALISWYKHRQVAAQVQQTTN